jgi:hypothetical protein
MEARVGSCWGVLEAVMRWLLSAHGKDCYRDLANCCVITAGGRVIGYELWVIGGEASRQWAVDRRQLGIKKISREAHSAVRQAHRRQAEERSGQVAKMRRGVQ